MPASHARQFFSCSAKTMSTAIAIFALLVAAVGLFLFLQGVLFLRRSFKLKTDGLEAEAEIVRVDTRKSTKRQNEDIIETEFFTEIVRFVTWDGKTVTTMLPEKNEFELPGRVGDKVKIRYNPSRPREAERVRGTQLFPVGLGLTVFGLLAIAGSYFILRANGYS